MRVPVYHIEVRVDDTRNIFSLRGMDISACGLFLRVQGHVFSSTRRSWAWAGGSGRSVRKSNLRLIVVAERWRFDFQL